MTVRKSHGLYLFIFWVAISFLQKEDLGKMLETLFALKKQVLNIEYKGSLSS